MVNFKQLLDKATNSSLSDPDWEAILEIVEEIKSKNVNLKTVTKEMRKHLLDSDSTVVYYTLLVLDSVMKNCSTEVHSEILSKEFMNVIKEVIVSSKSGAKAVDKALELVGEWKVAFGAQSNYKAVVEVFFEIEREGFHIPETQVASAAFMKKPPDFALNDKCYACRQEFNRFKGHFRHHCRNCGKSVCTQCSGKRAPLPEFGIDIPTRVCDICYKKVDTGSADTPALASSSPVDSDLPPEYLNSALAKESQTAAPPPSTARGGEDDDLQLAIAMSLNDAENKSAPKQRPRSPSVSITTTPSAPPPPASTLYASIIHDPQPAPVAPAQPTVVYSNPPTEPKEESDPTLARYLDRNYWEQRKDNQAPVAAGNTGPQAVAVANGAGGNPLADSVRKTVELFVARLQEVNSAGGNVATDPVILSHYQNLTALQPQLLKQIDEIQQKKAHQQEVIHKLDEAKEARVTLNRMRREHQDKVRQQEAEQAILARMQMEQKLALLRQQKAEQMTFQQALQKQRLDDLQSQRSEYEKMLAQQRESERLELIAKEQQVLQHQFGQPAVGMGYNPPAAVETLPFQSLSLEQSAPLPAKVDYTPGSDPAPPPYQPAVYGAAQPISNATSLYHPGQQQQSLAGQHQMYSGQLPLSGHQQLPPPQQLEAGYNPSLPDPASHKMQQPSSYQPPPPQQFDHSPDPNWTNHLPGQPSLAPQTTTLHGMAPQTTHHGMAPQTAIHAMPPQTNYHGMAPQTSANQVYSQQPVQDIQYQQQYNGAPMGVANSMAPPTSNPDQLLISFD